MSKSFEIDLLKFKWRDIRQYLNDQAGNNTIDKIKINCNNYFCLVPANNFHAMIGSFSNQLDYSHVKDFTLSLQAIHRNDSTISDNSTNANENIRIYLSDLANKVIQHLELDEDITKYWINISSEPRVRFELNIEVHINDRIQ